MFYTHLHPIFKQTQVEARYARKVWEFTIRATGIMFIHRYGVDHTRSNWIKLETWPILDTLYVYINIYTNQIPQVYQPDPTGLLAGVISSMASWELTAVSNCSAFEASHRVKNCGVSQQDKLGSLRSARFENSKGVHHPFSHIILLSHPPETAV